MNRTRFVVHGRVQGVGFRWFVQRTARRLGLVGFVQNQPDGTVVCEAEGSDERIAVLAQQLALGPSLASVTLVAQESIAPFPSEGFEVLR